MAASMNKILDAVKKSRFLRFGVPMLVIVVGGSFGLKEFRTLRYEIIDRRKTVDLETDEKLNEYKKKDKITIEGEYKKLQNEDIDTWHNIRGPRPWEDSKEFQAMQRENTEKLLIKRDDE
ncbi:cytochrome c oxidase assembly protein COX16 homolog, mitochondrial-like [Acanthaster planci]|uniref:Cytochrome c oxidase assembly protein COX16 homolog, mitochondrial n=1 Tax=Acanthaster planci TaxID=133434 RepID=A0A8B7YA80_ACAPL|nr:cytochrome c oxidase assembly protein COX16 homolog, mitochondrial-like [Acanthaster planci]